MHSAVSCKVILYADDSALLVSGNNISTIESTLSMELEKLNLWLIDNKLSLHLVKTESILFRPTKKLKQQPNLKFQCNGTNVNSTSCVQVLGSQVRL